MALRDLFRSRRKTIEAHQVALLAAAYALDLVLDGKDGPLGDPWPRFADLVGEDVGLSTGDLDRIAREQPYFQVFVYDAALRAVRTSTAGLAATLMDAWNYYLQELPQGQRSDFDYATWRRRESAYSRAWNDALQSRRRNPKAVQLPHFYTSMFFLEELCEVTADPVILLPIVDSASSKADSFVSSMAAWEIDRE